MSESKPIVNNNSPRVIARASSCLRWGSLFVAVHCLMGATAAKRPVTKRFITTTDSIAVGPKVSSTSSPPPPGASSPPEPIAWPVTKRARPNLVTTWFTCWMTAAGTIATAICRASLQPCAQAQPSSWDKNRRARQRRWQRGLVPSAFRHYEPAALRIVGHSGRLRVLVGGLSARAEAPTARRRAAASFRFRRRKSRVERSEIVECCRRHRPAARDRRQMT